MLYPNMISNQVSNTAQTMNEKYLGRSMVITGSFEGSDPLANIRGNFDDEGLSCGQLGKTVRAGDQQGRIWIVSLQSTVTEWGHACESRLPQLSA